MRFISSIPVNLALISANEFLPRLDPFVNFKFIVEIDGVVTFGFQEVSGLNNETTIVELEEGGQNYYNYKFAGQNKFSNLTFKRGISPLEATYFSLWREKVMKGDIANSVVNGSITLINLKTFYILRSWMFFEAWPCKIEISSFESAGNDIAVSTLELAVTRIKEIGV